MASAILQQSSVLTLEWTEGKIVHEKKFCVPQKIDKIKEIKVKQIITVIIMIIIS